MRIPNGARTGVGGAEGPGYEVRPCGCGPDWQGRSRPASACRFGTGVPENGVAVKFPASYRESVITKPDVSAVAQSMQPMPLPVGNEVRPKSAASMGSPGATLAGTEAPLMVKEFEMAGVVGSPLTLA